MKLPNGVKDDDIYEGVGLLAALTEHEWAACRDAWGWYPLVVERFRGMPWGRIRDDVQRAAEAFPTAAQVTTPNGRGTLL